MNRIVSGYKHHLLTHYSKNIYVSICRSRPDSFISYESDIASEQDKSDNIEPEVSKIQEKFTVRSEYFRYP